MSVKPLPTSTAPACLDALERQRTGAGAEAERQQGRYISAADPEALERALASAIIESSNDAIVSKTLQGIVASWNPGAMRIFGYTAAEMIGRSITTLIPPELQHQEDHILGKISRGERIEHFETQRLTKDGRRIEVSITVSPVRNSQGEIIGASKIARDISERKRAEQALRESERAMREADQRKDEFLALLAHELRNPLAPIRYALSAAKKAARTPEQIRRTEEIIERQVTHMSRLLDDLLDVSRITRGTLELKKSRTDLTTILSAAVEAARPTLDTKQHVFSLHLPREPVRIEADPVRLAQVFSNLLINASKYTDAGGRIELSAACDRGEIVVSVRDNGIGISAEMMPRLFTMFSQAEGALARAEGGLGIGLALARGLVALHGGTIVAHSEGSNCGSEFVVRFPIDTNSARRDDASSESTTTIRAPLRVLVVDDNRDSATTCGAFLQLCGHHSQVAYSGLDALRLAEESHPDVILLDIGMPEMDGYEVARRVRETPWGHRTTLIAVTGWGQNRDRQRAVEAGFNHHLTKPVDPSAVESLLQHVTLQPRIS